MYIHIYMYIFKERERERERERDTHLYTYMHKCMYRYIYTHMYLYKYTYIPLMHTGRSRKGDAGPRFFLINTLWNAVKWSHDVLAVLGGHSVALLCCLHAVPRDIRH